MFPAKAAKVKSQRALSVPSLFVFFATYLCALCVKKKDCLSRKEAESCFSSLYAVREKILSDINRSRLMDENQLSFKIIGTALELHRNIGPELLESAYENALEYDLRSAGLMVEKQGPMSFIYKGVKLDAGYRIDLLVENK